MKNNLWCPSAVVLLATLLFPLFHGYGAEGNEKVEIRTRADSCSAPDFRDPNRLLAVKAFDDIDLEGFRKDPPSAFGQSEKEKASTVPPFLTHFKLINAPSDIPSYISLDYDYGVTDTVKNAWWWTGNDQDSLEYISIKIADRPEADDALELILIFERVEANETIRHILVASRWARP